MKASRVCADCGKLTLKRMSYFSGFWKFSRINPPKKGGIPQRKE